LETTMADLRDHLKGIESASPPDLWAGIEARAREEGPEMDTNIMSIAAFRTRGQEQRRRIAAGFVAAAVVALIAVIAWRSFQPATTKLPLGADVPPGWERCTNEALGYSIGYPDAWHTTDVLNGQQDPAYACRWFSPRPFDSQQGNVVLEGWGYPLEVAIGGPFEDERVELALQLRASEVGEVLEEEPVMVDGHRAIRTEYVTEVDVVGDAGRHYQYLIELDEDTSLIVHTTETRGIEGDYNENKERVDDAVDTLRFTTAGP
jgi:hypothetical protein